MPSNSKPALLPTTPGRLSERIAKAVRSPWGRPIARTSMVLGAVVFLSWLGARSAASTPPPVGAADPLLPAVTAPALTAPSAHDPTSDVPSGVAEPAAPTPAPPAAVGVLPDGRVVINAATLDELCRLPGIGPARAAKIIELRTRLGGFKSPRQLLRVKGIGPRTLKRLTPLFVLDAPTPSSENGAT